MKSAIFIVVTILSTTFAYGADDSISSDQFTTTRTFTEYRAKSAQNREDKTFSLVAQPMGFGPGPDLDISQGLSLGYFLTHNSLLSIEATFGESHGPFFNWFGATTYETNTTSFGINYKRFFGNSFYVKAGFDYLQERTTASYPGPWFSGENGSTGLIQGNALAGELALGNQWQWSVFTIGCDWIGFIKPFLSNVTQDDLSANAPNSSRSQQDSEKDHLLVEGFPEFARFYLGASF